MDIIYILFKELRYILRNRFVKKYISFAIIIILLTILCSRVFAIDNDFNFDNDFIENFVPFTDNQGVCLSSENCYFVVRQDNYGYYVYFLPKEHFENAYLHTESFLDSSGYQNWNVGGVDDESFYCYGCYFKKSGSQYVYRDSRSYRGLQHSGGTEFHIELFLPSQLIYTDLPLYTNFQISMESYEVFVSTTEQTESPVRIYTNWFDNQYRGNYAVSIITNPDSVSALSIEMEVEGNPAGNSQYRYYFDVTSNGDYDIVFSLTYQDYRSINIIRKSVTNIISQSTGGGQGENEGGQSSGGGNSEGESSSSSSKDYTENFDELKQSINNTTASINNQTQAINNQTNAIEGTTQAVEETNSFLKDNTVDNSQFDMPTVEVNDPTANFFDTMFTGIYNAVTTDEEKTINVDLIGNTFSVNSADFNFLQASNWSLIRIILNAMWVIGIGLYILKDIRKMIEKIKDGNIENVTNDDIKADIV